ncbi:MAG: PIN domain-containing protein [Leucothrix sp.]
MPTNYVLIDFENVQPKNLALLKNHPSKVLVFVGSNQSKVSFELASAMQCLGSQSQYIKISGNGPNALDFHIAFYIGELSMLEPNAYFHIISKDTGFDPLVQHLKERKLRVRREKDLADMALLHQGKSKNSGDKVAEIIKNLAGRGQSKPKNVKSLTNTINSLFPGKMQEPELQTLVQELQKRKYLKVKDSSISYS